MKAFFSAYGKVVDATVMVDRESGRSKGFGFVTYEDASNADQLVGKLGLILDDKQVLVITLNLVRYSQLTVYARSKSRWPNPGANETKHGQPQSQSPAHQLQRAMGAT